MKGRREKGRGVGGESGVEKIFWSQTSLGLNAQVSCFSFLHLSFSLPCMGIMMPLRSVLRVSGNRDGATHDACQRQGISICSPSFYSRQEKPCRQGPGGRAVPWETHRPQPARAGVQSRDLWPPTVREALTLDLAEGIKDPHPPVSSIPEFTASTPLNVTRVDLRRPL